LDQVAGIEGERKRSTGDGSVGVGTFRNPVDGLFRQDVPKLLALRECGEGTKHHTVNLPYTMSFYASAGTPVAIAANYVDNSPNGWLEAKILVDDTLYKSGRSSGNEIATVSGTVP
jgi:hypothetical protein